MMTDKYIFPKSRFQLSTPKDGFVQRKIKSIQDCSLILLHACAGFGKTVFLAQVAKEYAGKAAVVSFCENDSAEDVAALLNISLSKALNEEPFCVQEADAIACVKHVVKQSGGRGITFLLDNIDKVSQSGEEVLGLLTDGAAFGEYRIIAAGQAIPNFMLRHILNGDCLVEGRDALSFNLNETAECVDLLLPTGEIRSMFLNDGSAVSDSVKSLNDYTDGWPALTAILLKTVAGFPFVKELSWRSVAEKSFLRQYIEYSVLSDMSADLVAYIKSTAFIEKCESDMCRYAFSISDAGEKQGFLVANGILVRRDAGSFDYPIYPLGVKQALCACLSHEEKGRLSDDAAEYYIDRKMYAEAFSVLGENGKAEGAAQILKRYGNRLIDNGEFELVGYCGEMLDTYGVPYDAEILGFLAQYHYYRGNYEKMESCFNSADSMFGKENKYSACRSLYNGLLRFNNNAELYSENIRNALFYLRENKIALPFLYQRELDVLKLVQNIHDESVESEKPLSVRRFGNFCIIINFSGKELQWRTKKAAELMAYMIETGGKPVERDTLLNLLWPFGMPNNAVAMLHNIFYNIRKELAAYELDSFIIYKNRRYSLDISMLSEDSGDIGLFCKLIKNGDFDDLLKHEKVVENYWGIYLQNIDSEWANNKKEYYDRCYSEACIRLAEYYRENAEYDRELVFLKNALLIDPYSEKIVLSIILCYFAMGKPDKAKNRYEDYCRLIDSELGATPSDWLRREYLSCFAAL